MAFSQLQFYSILFGSLVSNFRPFFWGSWMVVWFWRGVIRFASLLLKSQTSLNFKTIKFVQYLVNEWQFCSRLRSACLISFISICLHFWELSTTLLRERLCFKFLSLTNWSSLQLIVSWCKQSILYCWRSLWFLIGKKELTNLRRYLAQVSEIVPVLNNLYFSPPPSQIYQQLRRNKT